MECDQLFVTKEKCLLWDSSVLFCSLIIGTLSENEIILILNKPKHLLLTKSLNEIWNWIYGKSSKI